MLIVEEGASGGFAAQVMQYLVNAGHMDSNFKVRAATLPDSVIDHAERDFQLETVGLDATSLLQQAESLISDNINMANSAHS